MLYKIQRSDNKVLIGWYFSQSQTETFLITENVLITVKDIILLQWH